MMATEVLNERPLVETLNSTLVGALSEVTLSADIADNANVIYPKKRWLLCDCGLGSRKIEP